MYCDPDTVEVMDPREANRSLQTCTPPDYEKHLTVEDELVDKST